MPVWGVLIIVLVAIAVAGSAFVGILGLTSLSGGAIGSGQPGALQTDAADGGEPAGTLYTSTDPAYEVTFPGEPLESSVTQTVSGYVLETVTVSWVSSDRNVSINTTEFPSELFTPASAEPMLNGSLEGAAAAVDGDLEDVEFIEVDGERAISGVIRTAMGDVYMVVLFHGQVQFTIASVNGTPQLHDDFVATLRFTD
jgi:hypothetical protein